MKNNLYKDEEENIKLSTKELPKDPTLISYKASGIFQLVIPSYDHAENPQYFINNF